MATNGTIINRFKNLDTTGLPDLSGLDERQQTFWVLRAAQDKLEIVVMTPTEISDVLRDVYGVLVSRQKVSAILSGEKKGTVAKRKKAGTRAYQLMNAGSAELDAAGDAVLFIDPAQGYTKLRETQALLATLGGDLRVCDPYVDERTLDMLAGCTNADSINLLTENVKKPAVIKQMVKPFVKEHGVGLEIKLAPAGTLHDRYVIHGTGMLVIGTSLNGLGLKQSIVVAVGDDLRRTVMGAFDAVWNVATPI